MLWLLFQIVDHGRVRLARDEPWLPGDEIEIAIKVPSGDFRWDRLSLLWENDAVDELFQRIGSPSLNNYLGWNSCQDLDIPRMEAWVARHDHLPFNADESVNFRGNAAVSFVCLQDAEFIQDTYDSCCLFHQNICFSPQNEKPTLLEARHDSSDEEIVILSLAMVD